MIPGSLQGLTRTPQEPLKMPQSASKTSPRCLMALSDAFKVSPRRIQDALSLPKIPPESPKTPQDLSKARFSMAWETKNCNCSMISILINNHPALENSKHLSGDGGMRGAIRRPTAGGAACWILNPSLGQDLSSPGIIKVDNFINNRHYNSN